MDSLSEGPHQKIIKLQSSEESFDSTLLRDLYQKCLCHHDNQGVIKYLMIHQDKHNQSDILMRLSVVVNLYDGNSANVCNAINRARLSLAKNEEFLKGLVGLLGHKDRLVAFSSSKSIRSILSACSKKMFSSNFLNSLTVGFSHDVDILDRHPDSDLVNLRVCTFDTWKGLLKNLRTMEDGCFSMATVKNQNHLCTNCIRLHKDQLANQGIDDVVSYLTLLETKMEQTLDNIHKSPKEDSQDTGIILISFIDLMVEVVKHSSRIQSGFFIEIILKLMPFLATKDSVLCKRILDVLNQTMDCSDSHHDFPPLKAASVTIATAVIETVISNGLQKLPLNDGFVGFGGKIFLDADSQVNHDLRTDRDQTMLRKLAILVLRSCWMILQVSLEKPGDQQKHTSKERCGDVLKCLACISALISTTETSDSNNSLSEWICNLFSDQDEDLVLALLLSFNIHTKAKKLSVQTRDVDQEEFTRICELCNPHEIFVTFLQTISFDHSVPLDWLISSETRFLEYFVKYLKFADHDWDNFCQVCESMDGEDAKRGSSDSLSGCADTQLPRDPFEQRETAMDSEQWKEEHSADMLGQDPDLNLKTDARRNHKADTSCIAMTTGVGEASRMRQHENESTDSHSSGSDEPDSDSNAELILQKVMTFFTEIREAIVRLQSKNLFPYPPQALLKLLIGIQHLYEQSADQVES